MQNEKPQEEPKTDVEKWFEELDCFNSSRSFPTANSRLPRNARSSSDLK
jgi:hypothetical protein